VESGIFEAPTPGIGLLFLQVAGAAGPPPRPAEQMFGDWAMMRGGKALCTFTLEGTPVRDSFALSVKPDCDQAIARIGIAAWRMDGTELLLVLARGNPWRFEEVDAANWKRVPEGADPVTLVKK
jgi:hypothetical protein